jgi:hypothetical protein
MPAAASAALALAVSGGASALAPPLGYDQLAYFVKIACCPSEHERAVKQQLYQTAVHGRADGSSSEKVLSRMIVRPPPKNPGSLPRTLSLGGSVVTK